MCGLLCCQCVVTGDSVWVALLSVCCDCVWGCLAVSVCGLLCCQCVVTGDSVWVALL